MDTTLSTVFSCKNVRINNSVTSNKTIVDIRLRPGPVLPLVSRLEYTLLHRLFLATVRKRDVIHKTGST